MIYLDLDGVLANFDKAAEEACGTDNIYKFEFVHGPEEFWKRCHASPTFFLDMEMMPGAELLLRATEGMDRTVLTALPSTGAASVDQQKRSWVQMHLGYGTPVITCQTKDKPNYCQPGDLLIDDRAINRKRWLDRGGQFILHKSVGETMLEMYEKGYLQWRN